MWNREWDNSSPLWWKENCRTFCNFSTCCRLDGQSWTLNWRHNVGRTRLERKKRGSWSFLDVTLRYPRSPRPSRRSGQTLPRSAFSPRGRQRTGPSWASSFPDTWGGGRVQFRRNKKFESLLINGECWVSPWAEAGRPLTPSSSGLSRGVWAGGLSG